MKPQSEWQRKRDQRIADSATDIDDRPLRCTANGCPNRWSVDAGKGRCCSAHAWAEQHHWPQITQEQLDAETERAMRQQYPVETQRQARPDVPRLREQLVAMAHALRGATTNARAWAHRLRAREQRGERINDVQRAAWREALGNDAMADDERAAA